MQTIALDWLQFTLLGSLKINLSEDSEVQISKNIFLRILPFGDKHFINSAILIYGGLEFAKISFNPRSEKILDKNMIIFKVLNQNLYSRGFIKICKEIWRELNLKFHHIGKIDIAIDTTEKTVMSTIKSYLRGNLIKKGRGQLHTTFEGKGVENLKYWRIGQGISDKLMRGYYKEQEAMKLGKFYILDFWKKNGWTPEAEKQNVERIEVSARKEAIDEVVHDNLMNRSDFLEKLEDFNFLYKLFNSLTNGFFEFVKKIEYKRKKNFSKCKKIGIEIFTKATILLNKIKCYSRTEVKRIKIVAKTLFAISKITGSKMYNAIAAEMCENIDHFKWFQKSLDRWEYEIKNKLFFGNFRYENKYIRIRHTKQINLFFKPIE